MELAKTKNIRLEGNICKVITAGDNKDFEAYLNECIDKDKENRKRRLKITEQVQHQNADLVMWKKENENINTQLKISLDEAHALRQEAESAKDMAQNDLEVLQKKAQFEMVGMIVRMSIWVIGGVGVTVTSVYLIMIFCKLKADIVASVWMNIMSILLTNSFSIVGTLMGIKTMKEK